MKDLRREGGFEEEALGVIDEEERRIDDGKEGESTRYENRMRMTDTMRVRWVIPEQRPSKTRAREFWTWAVQPGEGQR